MALSNKDRVTRAMDAVAEGLAPYVVRELKAAWGAQWEIQLDRSRPRPMDRDRSGKINWDAQAVLGTMFHNWNDVFGKRLGRAERAYASELIDVRNSLWGHNAGPVSSDDAIRALDTAERLLTAVGAAEKAEELRTLRAEAQRIVFDEQARNKTRY